MRLRSYLLLLVLTTLAPLLAFSAFVAYETGAAYRRAVDRELLDSVHSVTAMLDERFDTSIRRLQALATSPHLDRDDLKAFHDQARRAQAVYEDWVAISLFDPEGHRLLYTPRPFGEKLPPRAETMAGPFRALVESRQPGVSDLFEVPTRKSLGFSVGVPILREGTVRYVISAGIDGAAFAGVLKRQRIPEGWTLTLLDRRHVIAAHSNLPERVGEKAPAPLAARIRATPGGVVRETTAEGAVAYTTFARSPRFGWTASLAAPAAAVDAGVFAPVRTVLAVGAALILVGAVLALLVGRRVDRSIRGIVTEADRLGRGETPQPVPSGILETAELSASLAAAGGARARVDEELRNRARRQAALADFGRRALTGGDLGALMDDAVRVVAEVLAVECVALLELRADGLHLRAGAGWPTGAPGVFPVAVGLEAPAHALVVIADVPAQADFPVPPHMRARGVAGGLTVVVGGVDAAWGLLGAYGTETREFAADDVSFLQALANELGTLIQREGAQAALRTTQEQLAQSQKMEAVGRLAGGLAHDFNNFLTVIAGRAQLLSDTGALDPAQRRGVDLILESTRQAATVTRQLLAFSRRQVLQPQVIDLNTIVGDMEALLRGLIGEDVELAARRANDLGRVRADPGQVAQVILNLVVNARDAMPAGGRLLIETRNADLDEWAVRAHPEVEPGRYVMLAVMDTGIGMDETVRARIFEPFFTTKQVGKGTGLGLATVYGTVRQSGGYVWVDSELGQGSTFTIYLPRVDEPLTPMVTAPTVIKFLRGTETVLVVEDEPEVRRLACDLLEAEGYSVLEAGTPAEALDLASSHPGPIELVVTDVVMPGMSGPELVQRLTTLRPSARALFMSGYTEEAMVHRGRLDARTPFLEKPFTTNDLVAAVRRVLDT